LEAENYLAKEAITNTVINITIYKIVTINERVLRRKAEIYTWEVWSK
jgi:hypothetical protein